MEATVRAPGAGAARGHLVLLGDSVFDNRAYVGPGPDVVTQLRGVLPGGWTATLAAVDGAVTAGVASQLAAVPPDATHLVVSVGGNDALQQEMVLGEPARLVGEALDRLAAVQDRFRAAYAAMLERVLACGLPVAVCSIYDPRFPDPARRRLARAGLSLFNDVIARAAFAQGLPMLDLRLICDAPADFANPIEPSTAGGAKIAGEIRRLALGGAGAGRDSLVLAGRHPSA